MPLVRKEHDWFPPTDRTEASGLKKGPSRDWPSGRGWAPAPPSSSAAADRGASWEIAAGASSAAPLSCNTNVSSVKNPVSLSQLGPMVLWPSPFPSMGVTSDLNPSAFVPNPHVLPWLQRPLQGFGAGQLQSCECSTLSLVTSGPSVSLRVWPLSTLFLSLSPEFPCPF